MPGSKRPATKHGFKDATSEPDQIRRWWEAQPDSNVAVRTGATSGLVVLDVDPQHGGSASLDKLIRQYGPLPPTPTSQTGRGGRHFYLAHTGGFVGNRIGLWPGIDVRGDGGYVIAPPSLHAVGQRYAWTVPPNQYQPAAPPEWLVARLRKASTVARRVTHRQLDELEQTGAPESQRNATLVRMVGRWVTQGYNEDAIAQKALAWNTRNRPPLSDQEVLTTVYKIMKRAFARDPAETSISIIVATDSRLTPRDHSLLIGLVGFRRRLGGSSLTFAAPYALVARYTPVRSNRAIRASLTALQAAELLRVSKTVSPRGREITQVTFTGKVAAVLEGDL